ncbi:MAG TPA: hypothetical protein VFU21_12535 [Kofleriaceae bacterium]|nr:hypothetical protein [Kofleriaceae bacterium]
MLATSVRAQPGAFRTRDTDRRRPSGGDTAKPVPEPAPAAEQEPDAAELAAAPPAHRASGHLREHDKPGGALRAIGNAVLWVPRTVVELGLWGPDLLAGRVDSYLDSRGPNVYGRGNRGNRWRVAAMLAWESPFGPSAGARVGRTFGRHVAADLTAVAFGRHGYTGRAGLVALRDGPVRLDLDGEYAHDRELVFAGIGDHGLAGGGGGGLDPFGPGPERIVRDRAASAELTAPLLLGGLQLYPTARFERHDVEPADAAAFDWDAAAIPGLGDPVAVGTGRVDLVYDARALPYPWIPRTAPSTGWRARAFAAWSGGDGFATGRYGGSAERLFDLFRGTRVLALRARLDAVTGDRRELPFFLLPSLGGPDHLRAFSRGRFRDEVATSGEIAYEWAVGLNARASLFIEVGGVHEGMGDLAIDPLHLSSGAAFRFAGDDSSDARAVVAGSDTGEWSFTIILGGV